MDKGLNFQFRRGLVPQGSNVLQGHLPGQHHPLGTHVVGSAGSSPVGDARLGGHVDINVRGKVLAGVQHTQVSHNKGIHARLRGGLDGLGQAVGLLIGGQGVHGQVDLAAAGVGIDDALRQLLRRKVGRSRAHSKFRQAAIHSVRAVVDGVPQAFQIARRGQQFRDLQHFQIPLFSACLPSQALTRQLSQRESPWQNGLYLCQTEMLPGSALIFTFSNSYSRCRPRRSFSGGPRRSWRSNNDRSGLSQRNSSP